MRLARIASVCLLAGAAQAEPIPFTATQSFILAHPPGLVNPPTLEFHFEAGGVSEVELSGSAPLAFTIPASEFNGTAMFPNITEGGGQPLQAVAFEGRNLAGSFGPGGGGASGFGGAMRLLGDAFAKYRVGFASGSQTVPLDSIGTSKTLMQVESLVFSGMGLTFKVPGTVTVKGGKWTTATITVEAMNVGAMGTAFTGTVMATGFDARTPNGAGTIQLVTPIRIDSRITLRQPGVGILNVRFAPEPGPGLLIVTGCLVLASCAGLRKRAGSTRAREAPRNAG